MTQKEHEMAEKNIDFIFEFEKYLFQHPEVANSIPKDSLVVIQVEGDDAFNQWSRQLADRQVQEGQPTVSIIIKKLGPIRSRIEEIELVTQQEKP